MRAFIAIAALAVALPLAACTNTRTTADDDMEDMDMGDMDMDSRNKGGAASRAGMFDASYSMAVGDMPGTRGGGMGGTLTGTLSGDDLVLDDGSYVDVYGVNLNAGDQITVDLNATAFDPYLVILTPDGQGFENDDWEGSRTHSRIAMSAAQAGPYAILVTSYAPGSTGGYEVAVEAPAEVVVVPPESLK